MTETSINYAKALYGLSVPGEAICETGRIFKNTPEIGKMLEKIGRASVRARVSITRCE